MFAYGMWFSLVGRGGRLIGTWAFGAAKPSRDPHQLVGGVRAGATLCRLGGIGYTGLRAAVAAL